MVGGDENKNARRPVIYFFYLLSELALEEVIFSLRWKSAIPTEITRGIKCQYGGAAADKLSLCKDLNLS